VSTDVAVALADTGDGSTTLTYDADAVVGGVIAGVGQRMLTGVSKKMAGEFFKAVDDVLTGKAVPVAAGGPAAEAGVFVQPAAPSRFGAVAGGITGGGFVAGAVVGAAIALAGVVVGGLLGRRLHR
jgi:hypothetical protein